MYTVEEARAMLPKVGDRLVKTPTLGKSLGLKNPKPRACTVVHVNEKNLWYTVRFADGTQESYKVPEINVEPNGGLL